MAVVAGTAEHDIFAVDLAREKYAIAVEGQQRIFQESEFAKIEGIADADGWSMVAVAPGDIITVLKPDHSWIVAVLEMADLRVIGLPLDGLILQLPIDAILEILTSEGRTVAQGALAWNWARTPQTIPIPGFRTVKQVEENAGAMEFGPLTQEQMSQIEVVLKRG